MDKDHSEAVRIFLGGKDWTVRLGIQSFRRAERHNVFFTLDDFRPSKFTIGKLCTVLWIGLLSEDRDLTEDQVLDWLDELTPEEAGEIFEKIQSGFGGLTDGAAAALGVKGSPNPTKPGAKAKTSTRRK